MLERHYLQISCYLAGNLTQVTYLQLVELLNMLDTIVYSIYMPLKLVVKFIQSLFSPPPKERPKDQKPRHENIEDDDQYVGLIFEAMMQYLVIVLVGYLNDFLRLFNFKPNLDRPGYVPLYSDFENFYRRNIFKRVECMFHQPIMSKVGVQVQILKKKRKTLEIVQEPKNILNFVSYNYLEMNQNQGVHADHVHETIMSKGISISSPRCDLGTTKQVLELETLVAQFLGVEAAFIVGMGFATNSTIIPILHGQSKSTLILADEKNHSSIALGCKLSPAKIQRFKHNDMFDLEEKLLEAVIMKSFKNILIVVEGIYSMEGTIVNLPELVRFKNKYKSFLFVDEAHSIGALGPNGRGVTDHFGIDPTSVDILMGTLTKSFGATGGYVAGTKKLIDRIKCQCHAYTYGTPMAPPIMAQISSTLKAIQLAKTESNCEGRMKLDSLAYNAKYFRNELKKNGFIVLGDDASPVTPILVFAPIMAFYIGVEMRKRGIGVAVVGFPATELAMCRIRLCLSSGHTKEMMDTFVRNLVEVADKIMLFRKK